MSRACTTDSALTSRPAASPFVRGQRIPPAAAGLMDVVSVHLAKKMLEASPVVH